jgi:hypothetical protein
MQDFPSARKYWAQALSTNPESAAVYAQIGLQSFLQTLYKSLQQEPKINIDSSVYYLNIPQDIRSAVWAAARGQSYRSYSGEGISMKQVEDAAQIGALNKVLLDNVPALSVLYCPAFYPNFDPITAPDYHPQFYSLEYSPSILKAAAEKAKQEADAEKNVQQQPVGWDANPSIER